MILKSKALALILLLPLMSLDSGETYIIQRLKQENQRLVKEIEAIDLKIQVVDRQLRYKDSIDAIKIFK